MKVKKYFSIGFVFFLFAVFFVSLPASIEAEENHSADNTRTITLEEYIAHGYTHISPRYKYSIVCPEKPKGIIPLSLLDPKLKGEILIFEGGENLQIDKGWVILLNAFKEEEIPDLKNISPDKEQEIIAGLLAANSYETVHIVEFHDNKGIYTITAKDANIDIDGDAKKATDDLAKRQMVKTFFRADFGGRYAFELLESPEIKDNSLVQYHMGLLSFHELDDV